VTFVCAADSFLRWQRNAVNMGILLAVDEVGC
jgi:hypothetical protein